MSGTIYSGPSVRTLTRDKDGHRNYEVVHKVRTSNTADGPTVVSLTPGLPIIGAIWAFGNDLDVWALCWPNMTVTPAVTGETTDQWTVKQKFSTKPLERCQDASIEDPLLEPQKVSGSWVSGTIEATQDRNGNRIASSSHEAIRGPQVEFDSDNPTVVIEQNVARLELSLFAGMVNKVNDAPLWGLPKRTIKLAGPPWSRKLYGVCNFYFTRRFTFEIDESTWDRDDILDEGTKALGDRDPETGEWVVAGDINDPDAFNRYQDKKGNVAHVILNGAGAPLEDGANPVQIPLGTVEYYKEANFLLLGIPTDLEAT